MGAILAVIGLTILGGIFIAVIGLTILGGIFIAVIKNIPTILEWIGEVFKLILENIFPIIMFIFYTITIMTFIIGIFQWIFGDTQEGFNLIKYSSGIFVIGSICFIIIHYLIENVTKDFLEKSLYVILSFSVGFTIYLFILEKQYFGF